MSSVGSSDSSNSSSATQTENLRKSREAQTNNDGDVSKKHQREIRRLTEQHYAELEKLKNDHNEQMNELRRSSHDELNQHDHKNQTEIEDLRGMYRKQLQNQADETLRREDTREGALRTDMDNSKTHAESRLKEINQGYEKSLRERDQTAEETVNATRDAQKTAIEKTRESVVRQYEGEGKSVRDDSRQRLAEVQKNFGEYRQGTEERLREQEIRHFQDQQHISNATLRTIQKERADSENSKGLLREGFKDGLSRTRENFAKAAAEQRTSVENARTDFQDKVRDRIDNQVDRLETEKEEIKDSGTRNEMQLKQKQQREMANIAEAYQKNMDNYKEQRDSAVRASNDRVHKSVDSVRRELGKQVTDTNRNAKLQENERNDIQKSAIDNLKGDFEGRFEQNKMNTENRVRNILDTTTEEKTRAAQMQEDDHLSTQRSHQDDLRSLRSTLEDDKQTAIGTMQERLQKQELQHSERMNQVVARYEKQVTTLKDQLAREKKINEENLKRTTEEMQHAHKLSVDQLESTSRARLRQADTQHSEEMKIMNKRNEEKINQVLAEVKKT